jgi:hypothetical protein
VPIAVPRFGSSAGREDDVRWFQHVRFDLPNNSWPEPDPPRFSMGYGAAVPNFEPVHSEHQRGEMLLIAIYHSRLTNQ